MSPPSRPPAGHARNSDRARRRPGGPALLLAWLLISAAPAPGAVNWLSVAVPGAWEDTTGRQPDGFAWYRCSVVVPADWTGKDVTLAVEAVEHTHEVYFNGARIGGAGRFPPDYQSGLDAANRYVVPAEKLSCGGTNLVALRVYARDGRGGFKGAAPQLGTGKQRIHLQGNWQFRTGDDLKWAEPSPGAPSPALFASVEDGAVPRGSGGHKMSPRGSPLSPAEAAKTFTVPEDLVLEQVLAEPLVEQPVFLNFDERGRLWVVQYRQYPAPAGLTVVSKDVFWRAVYDKVPEPPPRGVKGLDRISIHEDSDGDGTFDQNKIFVEGLNIATACVKGRGGVWVLNPPYLLFYPDRNNDDVPDGDPEVRLEGFGLEDTHSVVNSLRWGPDGWLYAAQGSTVTGNVRAPAAPHEGTNAPAHYSQGQHIWRYHPETRRYEIFAEGGGNAFGVEFDPQGRIFSGHNGGDTRGFHYAQGAYLRKGFEKHGELSNPYAFGYFPHMPGTAGERFTHNFIFYHGGALPDRYAGRLFGVEPLQGRVVLSEITPDGSTFRTRDLERVVTSSDSWFRPVDIKTGPDGAIYIADWYDRQVTHTRSQEGNFDSGHGRIYRLKAPWAKPMKPFDLGKLKEPQLLKLLTHENLWFRQTAQRLLADHHNVSLTPPLDAGVMFTTGQLALETLWARYACGALTGTLAPVFLQHPDAQVKLWTVRLFGDERSVSDTLARTFAELAARETNVEVRAQLACTAQRLPAAQALPLVRNLLGRDEDASDPRLPLLCWWALESKCATDPDAVVKLFDDSTLWSRPLVSQHILERVMRRFAAAGSRKDFLTCARLLQLAPTREHSQKLMKGFEEAAKGRSLVGLPDELIAAFSRHDVGSDAFKVRAGDSPALARALTVVADSKAPRPRRQEFIEVLGEVRPREALDSLLRVADSDSDSSLRKAALTALLGYDDPRIPATVLRDYTNYAAAVRPTALTLLASRAPWSLALAETVDAGKIKPDEVPLDTVRRLKLHQNEKLAQLLAKHWPQSGRPTSSAMQEQMQRLGSVVRDGKGDPYAGQKLYHLACASCHTLFARGGHVGPDLTTSHRADVDALLLHIVNPSAEIREGYENILIETKDDRSLTGFLVERDPRVLVLRGIDGQNVSLQQSDIAEMRPAGLSLMPEGLLDGLTDQQVRDLFAYLRSTQPLAN